MYNHCELGQDHGKEINEVFVWSPVQMGFKGKQLNGKQKCYWNEISPVFAHKAAKNKHKENQPSSNEEDNMSLDHVSG